MILFSTPSNVYCLKVFNTRALNEFQFNRTFFFIWFLSPLIQITTFFLCAVKLKNHFTNFNCSDLKFPALKLLCNINIMLIYLWSESGKFYAVLCLFCIFLCWMDLNEMQTVSGSTGSKHKTFFLSRF